MNNLTETMASKGDVKLLKKVRDIAQAYHNLLNEPTIDTKAVIENRELMAANLEKVRLTKRPETMLLAESAILQVNNGELQNYAKKEIEAGRDLLPEVKKDLTQLSEGIKAMDDALEVYRLRRKYGEEAYQDISVGSRQDKKTEIDKEGTAIDVLRKNTASQETRLGNMASNHSVNEIGRKEQYVLGKRRQNMTSCRNLYASRQKEFVKKRSQGHGLA